MDCMMLATCKATNATGAAAETLDRERLRLQQKESRYILAVSKVSTVGTVA